MEHIKRGIIPKYEPSISKIEWVTAIFVGQGMTKSHCLHIFKCQYLIGILRYGANFLHVIITFIGFKIAFSNIRSHGAPLLISRGWRLAPPPGFLTIQNTLGLIGLKDLSMIDLLYTDWTLQTVKIFTAH